MDAIWGYLSVPNSTVVRIIYSYLFRIRSTDKINCFVLKLISFATCYKESRVSILVALRVVRLVLHLVVHKDHLRPFHINEIFKHFYVLGLF